VVWQEVGLPGDAGVAVKPPPALHPTVYPPPAITPSASTPHSHLRLTSPPSSAGGTGAGGPGTP
jgi:hypothetical protein